MGSVEPLLQAAAGTQAKGCPCQEPGPLHTHKALLPCVNPLTHTAGTRRAWTLQARQVHVTYCAGEAMKQGPEHPWWFVACGLWVAYVYWMCACGWVGGWVFGFVTFMLCAFFLQLCVFCARVLCVRACARSRGLFCVF